MTDDEFGQIGAGDRVVGRRSQCQQHGVLAQVLVDRYDPLARHDHDDAAAARILAGARAALEPGGRLLLAEPMAGTRGAEPVGDAYFGLYLFAMRSGRPRTGAELESLLRDAGFTGIRAIPTRMPLLTRVIVADRPAA